MSYGGHAKGDGGGHRGGHAKGDGRHAKGDGQKGKGAWAGKAGGGGGELSADLERVSRELGQLLRHRGVQGMNAEGFAPLTAVIGAMRCRPTTDQVEAVVLLSKRTDGNSRFELWQDAGRDKWIRACDKRSVDVGPSGGPGGGWSAAPQGPAPGRDRASYGAGAAAAAGRSAPPHGAAAGRPAPGSGKGAPGAAFPAPPREQGGGRRGEMVEEDEENGVSLMNFDHTSYGDDYISLRAGLPVVRHRGRPEDSGWIYGRSEGREGWFPKSAFQPQAKDLPEANRRLSSLQAELAEERSRREALEREVEDLRARLQAAGCAPAGGAAPGQDGNISRGHPQVFAMDHQ